MEIITKATFDLGVPNDPEQIGPGHRIEIDDKEAEAAIKRGHAEAVTDDNRDRYPVYTRVQRPPPTAQTTGSVNTPATVPPPNTVINTQAPPEEQPDTGADIKTLPESQPDTGADIKTPPEIPPVADVTISPLQPDKSTKKDKS